MSEVKQVEDLTILVRPASERDISYICATYHHGRRHDYPYKKFGSDAAHLQLGRDLEKIFQTCEVNVACLVDEGKETPLILAFSMVKKETGDLLWAYTRKTFMRIGLQRALLSPNALKQLQNHFQRF